MQSVFFCCFFKLWLWGCFVGFLGGFGNVLLGFWWFGMFGCFYF